MESIGKIILFVEKYDFDRIGIASVPYPYHDR